MAARFLGRGRKTHEREPEEARDAVLADYRLDSVGLEHLDRFYERVGYPQTIDHGLLIHLGGVIDDEETAYLSVWRSEGEAVAAWRERSDDIEAVLADAPPAATVTQRSGAVHRIYLGDDLLEFRGGLAKRDPECVGFVIDLPKVDIASYDLVCAGMDFPDEWPEGLLLHFAGKVDDSLRVISVWRRPENSRDFFAQRLIPASVSVAREHGIFPEIRPRELRVRLLALNDSLYE